MTIICPRCEAELDAPSDIDEGRHVLCPSCGEKFSFSPIRDDMDSYVHKRGAIEPTDDYYAEDICRKWLRTLFCKLENDGDPIFTETSEQSACDSKDDDIDYSVFTWRKSSEESSASSTARFIDLGYSKQWGILKQAANMVKKRLELFFPDVVSLPKYGIALNVYLAAFTYLRIFHSRIVHEDGEKFKRFLNVATLDIRDLPVFKLASELTELHDGVIKDCVYLLMQYDSNIYKAEIAIVATWAMARISGSLVPDYKLVNSFGGMLNSFAKYHFYISHSVDGSARDSAMQNWIHEEMKSKKHNYWLLFKRSSGSVQIACVEMFIIMCYLTCSFLVAAFKSSSLGDFASDLFAMSFNVVLLMLVLTRHLLGYAWPRIVFTILITSPLILSLLWFEFSFAYLISLAVKGAIGMFICLPFWHRSTSKWIECCTDARKRRVLE